MRHLPQADVFTVGCLSIKKAKRAKPYQQIPDPWHPGEFIWKSEPNFCCEKCWEEKVDCTATTEKRRKKLDPKTFVPILTVEIK